MRRVALLIALALLFASRSPVFAQDVQFEPLQAYIDCYRGPEYWWACEFINWDWRVPVQVVMLQNLPVTPAYIWVPEDSSYMARVDKDHSWSTSVQFILVPEAWVYYGQARRIWIWVWGLENYGRSGSCLAGEMTATCMEITMATW